MKHVSSNGVKRGKGAAWLRKAFDNDLTIGGLKEHESSIVLDGQISGENSTKQVGIVEDWRQFAADTESYHDCFVSRHIFQVR